MRQLKQVCAFLLVSLVVAGLPAAQVLAAPDADLGRLSKINRSYQSWQAGHAARGGDAQVEISLGWSKALSREHTQGGGLATLDLLAGKIEIAARGLGDKAISEVWLMDNRAGTSVSPGAGDRLRHLGSLQAKGEYWKLTADLGPEFFQDFEVDQVIVARQGISPVDGGGVLFGSPSLFQRLYTAERTGRTLAVPGMRTAQAKTAIDLLDAFVMEGERLFNEETFDGNGRTCATCHPAEHNFTIDADFIATLPASDPLFVAEFNPDLATLERPALMRGFGLILENLDGFDDLENKFTMRGVPHTLGMSVSLTATTVDGTTIPPVERTGWSGDGSPGDGSLRSFATGAVTQHFPRTLARVEGSDFRLPTDTELDAMEAFQLALGRNTELDLSAVTFTDQRATDGLTVFLAGDSQGGTVSVGRCNACHANAGANFIADGANRNFATGVEVFPNPARDVLDFPLDGGFGRTPGFLFDTDGDGVPDSGEIFGNQSFNTVSLVEAADTAPFFHTNAVETIEGAVAFYVSDAFLNSPSGLFLASIDSGGIAVQMTQTDIDNIGTMLRIINVGENVRASVDFLSTALGSLNFSKRTQLIGFSVADTIDAIEVAAGGNLNPNAIVDFQFALIFEVAARDTGSFFLRNLFSSIAIDFLESGRDRLGSGF